MAALARFSYRARQDAGYDVLVDPLDGGHIARRERSRYMGRRFTLSWPIVQTAEKDAILAEFDAVKGAAGVLVVSHPELGTLDVIAVEDSISVRRRGAGRWALTLVVEVDR